MISIIGILSSIVLTGLSEARERARDTKWLAELRQLQTSLIAYKNTTEANEYPINLNSLVSAGYFEELPQSSNVLFYISPCSYWWCVPYKSPDGFVILTTFETLDPDFPEAFNIYKMIGTLD